MYGLTSHAKMNGTLRLGATKFDLHVKRAVPFLTSGVVAVRRVVQSCLGEKWGRVLVLFYRLSGASGEFDRLENTLLNYDLRIAGH